MELLENTIKPIKIESSLIDNNGRLIAKVNIETSKEYALNFITVFNCDIEKKNGFVLIIAKGQI